MPRSAHRRCVSGAFHCHFHCHFSFHVAIFSVKFGVLQSNLNFGIFGTFSILALNIRSLPAKQRKTGNFLRCRFSFLSGGVGGIRTLAKTRKPLYSQGFQHFVVIFIATCTFWAKLKKVLDILQAVCYTNIRKEVDTMSNKHKKRSGKQTDRMTSKINLIAAILNLVTVILIVIEKLLE